MKFSVFYLELIFFIPLLQAFEFFPKNEFTLKSISHEIDCYSREYYNKQNFSSIDLDNLVDFVDPEVNASIICFDRNEPYQLKTFGSRNLADFVCSGTTCPNGMCDTTGRCFCNDKYTTFEPPAGVQCNYKQKSRYGALLLEFFVGMETGAGYFYLGYTDLGVGQLVLFFPTMIFICIMFCCCAAAKTEKLALFGGVFTCAWFLGSFAWWLFAVIQMGRGEIMESNGAPTGESVYL